MIFSSASTGHSGYFQAFESTAEVLRTLILLLISIRHLSGVPFVRMLCHAVLMKRAS